MPDKRPITMLPLAADLILEEALEEMCLDLIMHSKIPVTPHLAVDLAWVRLLVEEILEGCSEPIPIMLTRIQEIPHLVVV